MIGNHKLFKCLTAALALVGLVVLNPSFSTIHAQMGGGGGMGSGQSMANMGSMGGTMLLSGGSSYRPDGTMLKIDDAANISTRFMNSLGNGALALDEVEEWEFNYYVVVKEAAPSNYKAFQLIIDKWTGFVMPEPGPNMMWNQKYGGMMSNMTDSMPGPMKRRDRKITEPTFAVTPEAARATANQFLKDRFARSLVVAGPPDVFFGYYNFDVNDVATGVKCGMLSVNGNTNQVWYHTWHGNFVQGKELN